MGYYPPSYNDDRWAWLILASVFASVPLFFAAAAVDEPWQGALLLAAVVSALWLVPAVAVASLWGWLSRQHRGRTGRP